MCGHFTCSHRPKYACAHNHINMFIEIIMKKKQTKKIDQTVTQPNAIQLVVFSEKKNNFHNTTNYFDGLYFIQYYVTLKHYHIHHILFWNLLSQRMRCAYVCVRDFFFQCSGFILMGQMKSTLNFIIEFGWRFSEKQQHHKMIDIYRSEICMLF